MSSDRTTVLVCRGCCCGTERKHPDTDHAAQLDTLRAAVPTGRAAKLWTVDCLGPCDHSNVITVRSGGTRRWFGDMLVDDDNQPLASWIRSGAKGQPPAALKSHEFTVPHEPAVATTRSMQLSMDQLSDFAYQAVRAGGVWSMGVPGAVAEFDAIGAAATIAAHGHVVEAYTDTGAIRLHLDTSTRVFYVGDDGPGTPSGPFIFASVGNRPPPRHAITELGFDADPIHPEDRRGLVFDLGIGRSAAAFCVRAVGDSIDLLRSGCGHHWRDVYDHLAPALTEQSPHSVVFAGRGRAEITSPSPAPATASPAGSHTHLLPGEVELGRDLPPGLTLPAGFQPSAIFFPPPGWSVPKP